MSQIRGRKSDVLQDNVSILGEFMIDIAFGNDFEDTFADVCNEPIKVAEDELFVEKEDSMDAIEKKAAIDCKVEIPDTVLYRPGEEPEEIRARLERLFEKLDSAYPDKVVFGLNSEHKHWGETVTELYRKLGYTDGNAFLNAYGYTTRSKAGRPANDPMIVIEELKRRYAKGATCEKMADLIAENPDLAPKFSNLMNQSDKLFGMTLAKYLIQEGILFRKGSDPEEQFGILKTRYLNQPYDGQIKELMADNPDIDWSAVKKKYEKSGSGVLYKEYLIKEGILKRKEKPIQEPKSGPSKKGLTVEEKKHVLDEIMQYGKSQPRYSVRDLLEHFPDWNSSKLRGWTKEIYGVSLSDYFIQGGAVIDINEIIRQNREQAELAEESSRQSAKKNLEKVESDEKNETAPDNLYDDMDKIDIEGLAKKAGVSRDSTDFPKGRIYTVEKGGKTFYVNVKLKATIRRVSFDKRGFDAKKPLHELMTRDELLQKYDPNARSMGYWTGPIEYRDDYPVDRELSDQRILFLRAIGALISDQKMIEAIVDYAPKKKDGSFKRNQFVRIASSMLGVYPSSIFEILGRAKDDYQMDIAFEEGNVNENTWEKSCQDFISTHWDLFK